MRAKSDATVDRMECAVNCLQMSVAGPPDKGQLDTRRIQNEKARRAALKRKTDSLRADIESGREDVSTEINEILDGECQTRENDAAAASGFSLENHDYVIPFAHGGTPVSDAVVSHVLHLMGNPRVTFVPPAIALVMDNATTNKSIHTLRALALILELIPAIQEIHLLYATVGHTHNSVDAHFGTLCVAMDKQDAIATPHGMFSLIDVLLSIMLSIPDLKACIDGLTNSHGHLDYDYYVFAKGLSPGDGQHDAITYHWILEQHYFLLFRDKSGSSFSFP